MATPLSTVDRTIVREATKAANLDPSLWLPGPLHVDGLPSNWGCSSDVQAFILGVDSEAKNAIANGHHDIGILLHSALWQAPVQALEAWARMGESEPLATSLPEIEVQVWVIAQDLHRALMGGQPPRFDERLRWYVSSDYTPAGWLPLIRAAVQHAIEHPEIPLGALSEDYDDELALMAPTSRLDVNPRKIGELWFAAGQDHAIADTQSGSYRSLLRKRPIGRLLLRSATVHMRLGGGHVLEAELHQQTRGPLAATVTAWRMLDGRFVAGDFRSWLEAQLGGAMAELLQGDLRPGGVTTDLIRKLRDPEGLLGDVPPVVGTGRHRGLFGALTERIAEGPAPKWYGPQVQPLPTGTIVAPNNDLDQLGMVEAHPDAIPSSQVAVRGLDGSLGLHEPGNLTVLRQPGFVAEQQ